MAVRSVEVAVRETVGAWLASLSFTPLDGGDAYQLATVRPRPPCADAVVTYPSAAVACSGRYDNSEPHEIPGSRDPDEGAGTYLEQTGHFLGQVSITLYATDEETADELVGGVEQALVPEDEDRPRLVLTATDYHSQPVRLTRREVMTVKWEESAGRSVYRPVVMCDVDCPIVRERVAADLQPLLDLTVNDDGEYRIDPIAGTTTAPVEE